jgi:hypothetical protein
MGYADASIIVAFFCRLAYIAWLVARPRAKK